MGCTKPTASFALIIILIFWSLENVNAAEVANKKTKTSTTSEPAKKVNKGNQAESAKKPTTTNSTTTTAGTIISSDSQKSWGVGVMFWPETVQITDRTGRSFDASVQVYTPSLHYGVRDNRKQDGYLYEGYLFYGKADIQANSGLTYFQKRVSVYGLGGSVGWYYRPESRQVNFGLSIPVQIRHAAWTSPPDGGEVNKKDLAAIGLMLDVRWRLTEDLAVNQRLGSFAGYRGSLWMMNIEWTL